MGGAVVKPHANEFQMVAGPLLGMVVAMVAMLILVLA